ncbi:MAG TPA: hypothetical protein VFO19_16970, partial [Vicinamibacterales bacterium]|nr:hypothetical protein [Vicinamibacterales bacterium]
AGTGGRDPIDAVTTELSKQFDVVAGPWAGAAAMVIVGAGIPDSARAWTGPAFAVTRAAPAVAIVTASAPRQVQVNAKAPVAIAVATTGIAGRRVELSLTHDGRVVDSTTIDVTAAASTLAQTLSFVPTREGAARLEVTARVVDAAAASSATLLVDVNTRKWRVLFVDSRPSWSSTFVRRAIERDERFEVASRVATSRNVSAATPGAPAQLDDAAGLGRFDAIVAGASTEMSAADIRHLETFARTRGGTLVLLLEARPSAAVEALIGVRGWQSRTTTEPTPLSAVAPGHAGLSAAELAWPASMPALATPLASFAPSAGAAQVPVVWQHPLGDGAVIVSTAFDAWRWRAAEGSTFDAFWRETIGEAAARAPAAIEVDIAPVTRPGDRVAIRVTARELAAAADEPGAMQATASARITAPDGSSDSILLVPIAPGRFEGHWRASTIAGVHRVSATVDDGRGEAIVAVDATASRAPIASERLSAWTSSRKGRVFSEHEIAGLATALTAELAPAREDIRWHPMRSPWWIVPFAALAGFEWMNRRKRSLI